MSANRSESQKAALPEVTAEQRASEEAGFALDLTQQIEQLRESRGLTQSELGALVGTHQQQISRLEDPEHQPSVRMLRKVARALRAYLDITLVPHESLERYFRNRFQPVLHDRPDPLASAVAASEFGGVQRCAVQSVPSTVTINLSRVPLAFEHGRSRVDVPPVRRARAS